MDINKHRYYMMQVLLAVFRHSELSKLLAFKGGTSLMLFHGLTRFATDLDFNLLDASKSEYVYKELRTLMLKYGTIDDEAMKFYWPILVLNYGKGERMLKVEVSNREYPNHYEIRSLLGTDIRVMTLPDMFAHKLCALGERITPRDIYDVWFFLQKRTEINEEIVRLRTGKTVSEYAQECAEKVRGYSSRMLMQGLGEVLPDNASKNFARKDLIQATASGLELFAACPLIAEKE
jgi:predicted nucleotidyltransferase component of viral defense system